MGNRWKHFGIREDTRGRARYLKREGKLIFQNKTGNDETKLESQQKNSTDHDTTWLLEKISRNNNKLNTQ